MSTRTALSLVLAALAAASCAGAPPAPPPPPASAPPAAAPAADPAPPSGLRLPSGVAPVRYAATLTIAPAEDTLSGVVDIDLTLREPTSVLWLNAVDLTVQEAHLEAGGARLAARAVPGGQGRVGFALDAAAPAGPARLHVAYKGLVSSRSDRGVFKEKEGDEVYVFTQFENTEARKAFPCFDEPSYKVPWQLTLRVPAGDAAVSNTPAVSETAAENGMKVVRFAETKPMPSYLVAFAVGPFDIVDAGKGGARGTPLRIVVPKGRQADAAYAVASTGEILKQVEDFLGSPYPYEKLDVVAIPRTISFGAMENVGLITWRQGGMLAPPRETTLAFQQSFADTAAHEIAHQWFGDLVTMEWWNDIWLNEAFATWMESKTLTRWKPAWTWDATRVQQSSWAMRNDSLVSARSVRQPIASDDDIVNAFDGITYSKGAAVLEMFESWIGTDTFRKGVARYLREHAHKNATAADFLAAVSAEAGRDVAPAFSTFLDQPGVPVLGAEVRCGAGEEPRILLTQERYLPAGSKGEGAPMWQVPVCARFGGAGGEGRACALLTERAAELPLSSDRCPAWVVPNEGGNGYYHVAYTPEALDRLLGAGWRSLTLPERLGVVRDLQALMASGKLSAADALGRIPALLKDPSPYMLRAALMLVAGLPEPVIPEAQRPAFARFLNRTFGARARALGWHPKAGEDQQLRLLRPLLVPLMADRGEDAALRAEGTSLALKWLDDPAALEPDLVRGALAVAASRGDKALFDRLRAAVVNERDQRRRVELLRALASFRDPALVREALGLVLTDELDVRDAIRLLFQDERSADVVFAFVKERFDAVVAKLPPEVGGLMPRVGEPFCDAKRSAELSAFFKDRVGKLPGATRELAQTLEQIAQCTAFRDAQGASLTAFLAKQGGARP